LEQSVADDERQENGEPAGGTAETATFSATVIHHAMEPTHWGEMGKRDGHAVITGPCGDTDEFSLRVLGGRIREISFRTTGCFFTIAACDAAAFLADGKTIREALRITKETVLEYLGGLPADHEHCALLAADTLHKALRAYIVRGKDL
jgi:nitrogen fixation NifU-like protein